MRELKRRREAAERELAKMLRNEAGRSRVWSTASARNSPDGEGSKAKVRLVLIASCPMEGVRDVAKATTSCVSRVGRRARMEFTGRARATSDGR